MQDGRADAALDPRPLELNSSSPAQADSAGTTEQVQSKVQPQEVSGDAHEVTHGANEANDGRSDVVEQPGEARQTAQDAQQVTAQGATDDKEGAQGDHAGAQAGADSVREPAVAAGKGSSATSEHVDGTATAESQAGIQAGAIGAASDGTSTAAGATTAPPETVLAAPKPSNPAAIKSSLLLQVDGHPSPTGSPAGSVASGTPPLPVGTAPVVDENGAARASPAPSASSAAGSTTADKPVGTASAHPPVVKKFSSSLSVNKKFLEKAGEKAKPEIKPVASTSQHSTARVDRTAFLTSRSVTHSSTCDAARAGTGIIRPPASLRRQAVQHGHALPLHNTSYPHTYGLEKADVSCTTSCDCRAGAFGGAAWIRKYDRSAESDGTCSLGFGSASCRCGSSWSRQDGE